MPTRRRVPFVAPREPRLASVPGMAIVPADLSGAPETLRLELFQVSDEQRVGTSDLGHHRRQALERRIGLRDRAFRAERKAIER